MRATINFDIDLDKVEDTMATLISQEAGALRVTADILENLGAPARLIPEVTEAVDLLRETLSQLQQYKDMLIHFEQAKFQTMLPQPAPAAIEVANLSPITELIEKAQEAQRDLKQMGEFDSFIDRIATQEGSEDVDEPEEG